MNLIPFTGKHPENIAIETLQKENTILYDKFTTALFKVVGGEIEEGYLEYFGELVGEVVAFMDEKGLEWEGIHEMDGLITLEVSKVE